MTTNRSGEELAMRDLIVPELRRRWPTARIIHELPTRYSSNRIDLAAIGPDMIVGVEIKSSRDVIDRLAGQLRAFYPITHRLIVALAPKWNEKLPPKKWVNKNGNHCESTVRNETQQIIRDAGQIDTWTCDAEAGILDTGRLELYPLSQYDLAPHRRPWAEPLLDILHVEELKQVAYRHRIAVGRRANHTDLVAACHEQMTNPEIVRAVCRTLRARAAFYAGTDDPIIEQAAA